MIDVHNLVRRFGELEAVKGVSFEVAEGDVFGFLGPNGAGKTTTISVLCTLLRPTSGRAAVNGFDVVRHRNDVRRSIGLVFQQPTLDETLSAEQNLRFHGYAYGVPGGVREERIREVLALVELWDRRGERVRTFSGGMKRRLEIARGLLHHPRVLFLDEPTLGLDPQTRRRVWEYLSDLRARENLTIFLTTHYMDEAENCDRIAVSITDRSWRWTHPTGSRAPWVATSSRSRPRTAGARRTSFVGNSASLLALRMGR
jgi:ABC-2 type transport system ATP-binding protein